MNLYLLERTGIIARYEYVGHVVRTESESQARRLVSHLHVNESPKDWLDPKRSRCHCIGYTNAIEAGVILSSFKETG